MSYPKTTVIRCPDCGIVDVENDVFDSDAGGKKIGVSGLCPKCGDRLYFAPADKAMVTT